VREHLGADVEPPTATAIVAALSLTVTVSYGVLLYAFPVLFVPMRDELALTASQLSPPRWRRPWEQRRSQLHW
jgi:hypothetical protein